MTAPLRSGLIASAAALVALGLAGCASSTTTGAPLKETAALSQEAPQAQVADQLQSIIDAARPTVEIELRRYSDVYSDALVDSEGSQTLVYRYTYRNQVDVEQARNSISSNEAAYEGFAKSILSDMKARGIDDPVVKWVYYNADGTLVTTVEFAGGHGSASAAQYPTDCPAGFVDALGATLPSTKSASKVEPASLGLGALSPRIACAVRTRPPGGSGVVRNTSYNYVVMQADVSESEVRSELEGLGFSKEGYLGTWHRKGNPLDALTGEIWDVNFRTFGDLSDSLIGDGPQWSKFRDAFPPQTVVLWGTENPYASG